MNMIRLAAGLSVVVLTAGLGACSSDRGTSGAGGPAFRPLSPRPTSGAASRKAVAGDRATVTSIINSASADPHSFEASPVDAAAISDASLVVYNGGGYDQWVDDVLTTHPDVASIDAYSLLNAAALGEPNPANEHVFYDLGTAKAVATTCADRLAHDRPRPRRRLPLQRRDLQPERPMRSDRPRRRSARPIPVRPSSPPNPSPTTCCSPPG